MIKTGPTVQKRWDFVLDQGNCPTQVMTSSTAQTAKGARTDAVYIVKRPATLNTGLLVTAKCTTAGQIILDFFNITVADINPAELTYEVVML